MISKLHYITQEGKQGETHAQMAERACKAGVQWVQLRIKDASANYLREQALETQAICKRYKATFILNDHAELAAELGADGVHLGKNDMLPEKARKILGNKIIGGTANTYEDICRLAHSKVDYIGLGPYRYTSTKQNLSPILALTGYKQILQQMKKGGLAKPIVAIGGLTVADMDALAQAGVHGVAVASLINAAPEPQSIIDEINSIFNDNTEYSR